MSSKVETSLTIDWFVLQRPSLYLFYELIQVPIKSLVTDIALLVQVVKGENVTSSSYTSPKFGVNKSKKIRKSGLDVSVKIDRGL